MSNRSVLYIALSALSALSAGPLGAQRPAPAAVVAPVAASAPVRQFAWRAPASADRRPRAWPYIVGGAFVGAVATAGGIALALADDDTECICSPIGFLPVVAGGAVLGAGGGYVVYRIRL